MTSTPTPASTASPADAETHGSKPARHLRMESVTHAFRGAAYRHLGGELVAVDDVSMSLASNPPQIVTLVGESGSGKSTVARMLLGLLKPAQGRVTFDGDDIYDLSSQGRSSFRRAVQGVFQDPYGAFNPFFRADRVLWKAIDRFGMARNRADALAVIEQSLAAVQLRPTDVLGRYPHQLSGGQRQRIMLARAHLLQPAFIVADEPVSAVDVSVQAQIMNLLLDLRDRLELTLLFIAHDLSVVQYISTNVGVMYLGRIVEVGPRRELFTRPRHPYTQGLLRAAPRPDPKRRTFSVAISGEPPSPLNPPPGCHFHTRCPIATERCKQEKPLLVSIGYGHEVACHHHDVAATRWTTPAANPL